MDRAAADVDSFSLPREWVPAQSWDLVEAVRGWAEQDVMPVRREIDEDWAEHALARRLLHRLWVELGYQQACWPEAYGGLGIGAVTSCLPLEEMSRADSGPATATSLLRLGDLAHLPAPPEPRALEHLSPRVLDTERWYAGCVALTEPPSGSDVENVDGTHGRHIRATGATRRS